MSSQYVELRPTNSWNRLASLGHLSKFQRVSRLGFVTAPTSLNGDQPNLARCLAVSYAGTTGSLHYIGPIHFLKLLSPKGILPGAKFTVYNYNSCVLLYCQRYCTHSTESATYIQPGRHHVGHKVVKLPVTYVGGKLPVTYRPLLARMGHRALELKGVGQWLSLLHGEHFLNLKFATLVCN